MSRCETTEGTSMPRQTPADVIGAEYIDTRVLIEIRDDLRSIYDENTGWDYDEDLAFVEAVDELARCASEDFPHGITMIREDRFADYAREYAEDIGAVPDDNQWPLYCIDWDKAARELAMDYSLLTFMGHEYYVR